MGSFLYIGAGVDLRRALSVCNRKNMVLVDSQPFSEYGKMQSGQRRMDGSDMYSRPTFPKYVANALRKHGFVKVASRSTNDVWVCTREGGATLTYYMNTAIPDDLDFLKPVLSDVDTLFVAGHWPHATVVDALPDRPLYFWGAHGTFYTGFHDCHDTVVCALHKHQAVRDRFVHFGYLARDGKKCTFPTWKEFYENQLSSR